MQTYEINTRTKRLGAAAAKPLLLLAVILGAIALAGPASANPDVASVSPSGAVCPGTVLTLTSWTSPPSYPYNIFGFGPHTNYVGTLVAHFSTWTVATSKTVLAAPYSGKPDTTQVTVPSDLYGAPIGRQLRGAFSINLWLEMNEIFIFDGSKHVSKGAVFNVSILPEAQCLQSTPRPRGPLPHQG